MADDAVTDLDPARYLRAPVLDVPGAIALGIALLSSTDGSLSGAPHASAKRLHVRVLDLQARWAEQRAVASAPKTDPRPADQRLDRAWAAVGRRLEPLSELPETVPEAKLAATLYALLFPAGLTFLAMAFEKQWAESEQRLEQIGDGRVASCFAIVGVSGGDQLEGIGSDRLRHPAKRLDEAGSGRLRRRRTAERPRRQARLDCAGRPRPELMRSSPS